MVIYLYHIASHNDDEIDEVLIVASREVPEERVLAEARDFIDEPYIERRYELLDDYCYIAELRVFVG